VQVCIATHTYDDLTVPIYIADRIGEHTLREKTRVTGIYHPIFAREFFKTYAIADLVVGMRGHSVICGTGLGTPTIALDTHDKVNGFMVEAGAADWSISPSQPGFMGKLYEKTNELLSTPENQTVRVSQATQQWDSIFKSFLKDGLRLS
jgi:polysaccharide pyruvyl transferase WcaK-like protein